MVLVSVFSLSFSHFLYQVLTLFDETIKRPFKAADTSVELQVHPYCSFLYGTSIRILLLLLLISCPYTVRRVNTIKRGQFKAADTSIELQIYPYAYS